MNLHTDELIRYIKFSKRERKRERRKYSSLKNTFRNHSSTYVSIYLQNRPNRQLNRNLQPYNPDCSVRYGSRPDVGFFSFSFFQTERNLHETRESIKSAYLQSVVKRWEEGAGARASARATISKYVNCQELPRPRRASFEWAEQKMNASGPGRTGGAQKNK